MAIFCECQGFECYVPITMSDEEYVEAKNIDRSKRIFVISNDCERGPEPTDVLVEKREGYSLYSTGEQL